MDRTSQVCGSALSLALPCLFHGKYSPSVPPRLRVCRTFPTQQNSLGATIKVASHSIVQLLDIPVGVTIQAMVVPAHMLPSPCGPKEALFIWLEMKAIDASITSPIFHPLTYTPLYRKVWELKALLKKIRDYTCQLEREKAF